MKLSILTLALISVLLWLPIQAQEVNSPEANRSQAGLFSQTELDQLMRYALANYARSSGASRNTVERDLSTFLKPEQLNYLILMDEESRRWEQESILDRPVGEDMKAMQYKALREWERLYGR